MLSTLDKLRTLGDPVLRTRAIVSDIDSVREILPVMERVMTAVGGIGLAAPQIGVLKQVLIYRLPDEVDRARALINPRLEWASDDQALEVESCLSIPGIAVPVNRPLRCRVRALDLRGEVTIEAFGKLARVLQHELDHLEGTLILDRTDKESRKNAMSDIRRRNAVIAISQ